MRFDFDSPTERRRSSSMKWDAEGDAPDIIPLWVADMDFRTAPGIVSALRRRVDHGIFGYVSVPDSYYEALSEWFAGRHGWEIQRNDVIYTSGVVPAVSAIIKALVRPGEGVILNTPAYNCFFSSIANNKCRLAESPLKYSYTPEGLRYAIDFDHLEQLASDPANTLMILCNPHNPTGRVWTRGELSEIKDICRRHGVRVVSDEIHCELIHPGASPYTPYATIDPEGIICCSPSKAFNTAGLQIANIIARDAETRARIDRAINDNEVCDVNPFGVVGLEAAYRTGAYWLDELNRYLYSNYMTLRGTFRSSLPELKICDSESTYLAWIYVADLGLTGDEAASLLLEKGRVRVSSGSAYHDNRFIRINYACPAQRLRTALDRIVRTLGN